MKIEVNKRGSKEYYDEFLYIATNYRKFQKDPKRKTHGLTKYLLGYECFILLAIVLEFLCYRFFDDVIFVVLVGMLLLLLLLSLYYHFTAVKRIRAFLNDEGNKSVEIDSEAVTYTDDSKSVRILFDELNCVRIADYGICFLPKNQTDILISINREYEDEVLQALKEAGRDDLIVNNSK